MGTGEKDIYLRGWGGGEGGGGKRDGGKRDGGRGGGGRGKRGGVRKFAGAGVIPKFVVFY